jgi:hypothetical protein
VADSKRRSVIDAAEASRLVVGEQGVMDGRQESRNGNRIVLDRKVSGGKQQGIAAKVVVDENARGRMGTSRDICVGAFVADWSCRDVKPWDPPTNSAGQGPSRHA